MRAYPSAGLCKQHLSAYRKLFSKMKPVKITSILIAILLLALFSPLPTFSQGQAKKSIAIRCGKLLDVKKGEYITNAVILIEGERIKEVGANLSIPSGTQVIDLTSATVLPGLIDCHTHLLQNYDGALGRDDPNMILTVTQLGTTKRALLGAAMG